MRNNKNITLKLKTFQVPKLIVPWYNFQQLNPFMIKTQIRQILLINNMIYIGINNPA